MKNFVIVHTASGGAYARRVASSIRWIHKNLKRGQPVNTVIASVNDFDEKVQGLIPRDTVIYSRAAYPTLDGWVGRLKNLENRGFHIINPVSVLQMTSNKLACALHLQGRVSHPKTWLLDKGNWNPPYEELPRGEYILKPETSMEQGAQVRRWVYGGGGPLREVADSISGQRIVLQEFVPYTAIYRVIVIGGVALPYSFVDRPEWHPGEWKVSVCLNRTTMKFVPNPSVQLLRLAEDTQRAVGGEINFIDIFETTPGRFVISEINTACNLRIHERLAERARHPMANIHYRIAKYLVNKEV
jgi:glutathione synthase/RimK-type ligase-like ATP-grasp enzyme